MKTSSPLERKIFLGSPGLLAKPKNFSGIGGGAATGGGVYTPAFGASGDPGASGVGIATSACATKIFRPKPSYLTCSAEASCVRCKVGSRLCGAGDFLPTVVVLWRVAGRVVGAAICVSHTCGAVAGAVAALVEEEGMNSKTRIAISTTSRVPAAINCFRFSVPSFTTMPTSNKSEALVAIL